MADQPVYDELDRRLKQSNTVLWNFSNSFGTNVPSVRLLNESQI